MRCRWPRAAQERRQCGRGPKCDDEPAERDGMTVDEILTESEPSMCSPCNWQTPARSVVQRRHHDGICEFVGPPRKKISGDKFTQMTSRGSQNWPVVPDRPYRAHHQARPERTDTLLKVRLSVATPPKFLTPGTDGQAEQTCARRGEPMGRCGAHSQSRQNEGDQSEQSWPE